MSFLNVLDKGLEIAKQFVGVNPVGAVLTIIDDVVEVANTNQGIDNENVLDVIYRMSKSKWNKLTPGKIERIKKILEE